MARDLLSAENNVLCLIYSDKKWDMNSTRNIRDLIAKYKEARKAGNPSLAWQHLHETQPACVRAKPGSEVHQTRRSIPFDSYRGKIVENRYKKFFFDRLEIAYIQHIAVYTTLPYQLRGFHRHCDLTLVIWD